MLSSVARIRPLSRCPFPGPITHIKPNRTYTQKPPSPGNMSRPNSPLPPFVPAKGESFKYTAAPNPEWKYGQGVETTEEGRRWMEGVQSGWKTVDPALEDPRKVYALCVSGIVPRPIAFVSTVSETGLENLALFSWFNQVTTAPAVISIACAGTPRQKDTATNIRATKGFTVNIISEPWIRQANACSIDAPPDVSEWHLSGLTREPSTHVKAARIKESAFSMECELLQTVDIEDPKTKQVTVLVLGLVKYMHIRNDMLNERGHVDQGKLMPVARMGAITYGRVTEGYNMARPAWSADADAVNALGEKGSKL